MARRAEYNEQTKAILDDQVALKKQIIQKQREEKSADDSKNIAVWQAEIEAAKRKERAKARHSSVTGLS